MDAGRGTSRDGAGVDDARPARHARCRRPAVRGDGGARRRRLHLGARHQLRPDLRALPPRRRAGLGDHPARGRRRPEEDGCRRGLLRDHPQHLAGGRRGGRLDAVPGAEVQAAVDADRRRAVDRSQIIRPVRNQDTDFFWEGTQQGELRLQTCNACGELRHPPGPVCPSCHAMDRGYVVASGRGTIFSFLVHHAPQMPGRELPRDDRARRPRGGRAVRGRRARQPRGPRDRRPGRRSAGTRSTTSSPCRSGISTPLDRPSSEGDDAADLGAAGHADPGRVDGARHARLPGRAPRP